MSPEENKTIDQLGELRETVDKLRKDNEHLEQVAKQADAANKAKSDFLAMISHEIRTPMNGVIGLTELLLDTQLAGQQKHYAGLILTSARNLLTLINSLLDFSKIEADMMELDIAEFNIRNLVGELMALYNVATEQKDVEVYAEIDPRVAGSYLGDSYRIRQILVNLLGNAMKFTEEGSVVLKVNYKETTADKKDLLTFDVCDTGPGIPPDKLDRLFKPFSQVDASSTRRYGGTGLGLSICQKLVELMGGDIGVTSEKDKGSTFWFTLPIVPVLKYTGDGQDASWQASAGESVQPYEKPIIEGVSEEAPLFLVVDDDETNRFVLETVLMKSGARVLCARHGKEAIEMYESKSPDLILMDCQMPVMDGFEASGHIQTMAVELSRKKPRIIALTADATQTTRQRCKEVGMDDYLTKPLEFGKLQRVIDSWLPKSGVQVIAHHHDPDPEEGEEFIKEDSVKEVQVDSKVLDRLRQNMGDISPVIQVFLDSLPERLQELKGAVDNAEAEDIRRVAHTLKGSSSQFGAVSMAALCYQIEQMGKHRQLDDIAEMYEKLEHEAEQVVVFLSEELDKK